MRLKIAARRHPVRAAAAQSAASRRHLDRSGWVASFRGDYVTGEQGALRPDPERDTRWRLSPALTYFPTEFSKIRLQYNYDNREDGGQDHSVWLQFEFLLGAHAAHKF